MRPSEEAGAASSWDGAAGDVPDIEGAGAAGRFPKHLSSKSLQQLPKDWHLALHWQRKLL